MIESGYYPMGAENDSNAPYNQDEQPEKEVEVTVSITLSKTVKIKVDDYITFGEGDVDYSFCNLRKAVKEQIQLPQDAYKYITDKSEDFKDWVVDDFAVELE